MTTTDSDRGRAADRALRRRGRLTVPELRARKSRRGSDSKICMVTAYDATFARLADVAGVDAILVGDSLGMVIQGRKTTLPVTLDEMIYHCRAVARGSERAHLACDLPFLSYQASSDDAVRSAGRVLKEGGAQSVKLEGGRAIADTIARLVAVGIPVIGHVGLTPQSVHAMGGFRVQGKSSDAQEQVVDDARAVADAGAYALVLEGMPGRLAKRVTATVDIPTIGIGAGADCDGQVLVGYDLLGMTPDFSPSFVKRYAEFWEAGIKATRQYCEDVRSGAFPAAEHTFEASVPRPAETAPAETAPAETAEATGCGPAE